MGNENIDNSSAGHSYFYVSYSFWLFIVLYCMHFKGLYKKCMNYFVCFFNKISEQEVGKKT